VGGVGIHLVEVWPCDEIGALLTWRDGGAPSGLGFRVGLAEDCGGDLAGYGGIDFTVPWIQASEDFPLDVVWFVGGGIGIGDDILLSFPFGVSLGRALDLEDVVFVPYVSPRLVLDAWFGDDGPGRNDDDLELNFVVDLGTDIVLSDAFTLRFGASLGDREALAIGIAFGSPL
jgi:hypothetical protein